MCLLFFIMRANIKSFVRNYNFIPLFFFFFIVATDSLGF